MKNIVTKNIDKKDLIMILHAMDNKNWMKSNKEEKPYEFLNDYSPSYSINDIEINKEFIFDALKHYANHNCNTIDEHFEYIKRVIASHQRNIDNNENEVSELQNVVSDYITELISKMK